MLQKSSTSVFPRPIYIGASARTPIGKFGGSLKDFSAPQLAALTLKEALLRAPEALSPDFVFLGHARQAGAGPNPARQAAVFSGLPESVPAITVNQACASGMTSLFLAAEKIALGRARSVWAGGVESMSNTPYFLMNVRWGTKMGHGEVLDGMSRDGFFCPMADLLMGETVEKYLAQELRISRDEQDQYALGSQQKALAAWTRGDFKKETFEIIVDTGKEEKFFREDEHRRRSTTIDDLRKLRPVFDPKKGTITAGNASGITDGAAFVHVTDELRPYVQAQILDYETVALDPKRMGLGPVPAVQNLLKRQNLSVEDLDAVELNEAFAAQVIACQRELHIPEDRLNAWGGAIAIGHPIGATGVRIVVTLLSRLNGKPGALGLATLCVSGGQGVALLVKALS